MSRLSPALPVIILSLIAPLSLPAAAQDPPEKEQEEEVAAEKVDETGQAKDEGEAAEEEQKAEEEEKKSALNAGAFSALRLRSIGPALTSGRVGDFAVNPDNTAEYYVAVCSGGIWKTTNKGTTFKPIFDGHGSYSIGCLAMDPNNANVVWAGTGENNSQRSVAFGDGVYKTVDGGKRWKNMGLKESEHIGMIAIDPRDSDVVYVAAQGPLWRAGGDRGLYKTVDGGETWERILHVSDDTGINEVHMDPRNPDVLYASSYQRRRRVWTQINGGPESAIYKSTDAGATWRKLTRGVPGGDKGRIGLDVSPPDPDVVYAIIQATGDGGGFFRSTDRGETWSKRNSYMTTSPQYYNEIICDPKNVDRVYVLDTVMAVTEDGGATFSGVPRSGKHVDDHALWIDPDNTDYLLNGCDGGIYDTYDRGGAWNYKPNLPVTQFYRVEVDDSEPFYFVYGGTQDNNTLGGPSRTTDSRGIYNEDWFVATGGDGFEPAIDPVDPNIVYAQSQYGGLVRFDRRSGERVGIAPSELPGEEEGYHWNWNSALIISPHDHKRLYFGANFLFRSDDYGNSWIKVSGDLSRQLDRDQLEVMGKIQKPEAIAKHWSTSVYGSIVALSESPLVEGLIYVGTDDGLIQVTEDGGQHWRRIDDVPDVPEPSYTSWVKASMHDADVVYAAFDNHKSGDFKPYLYKSTDRGQTWTSIAGDLPDRNIVYAVDEDHVKADLLFCGTEFAAYFTIDGGGKWFKIGGMPTISVRDLDIQRRENDLVLATFGRGFYILDDYTPMRHIDEEFLEQDAAILPVKDALLYISAGKGRGSQGASFYSASNPPYGAVFTYYVKEPHTSLKSQRKKAWSEAEKAGEKPHYPTIEELRAESEERSPAMYLTVRDENGSVIRRITASGGKGLHRTTWDLRYGSTSPISGASSSGRSRWGGGGGPFVVPGTYTVMLSREANGAVTELAGPVVFEVVPLNLATFAADDPGESLAFQQKAARLYNAIRAAQNIAGDAQTRLGAIRRAIVAAPKADPAMVAEVDELEERLRVLMRELSGDRTARAAQEATPPSISRRASSAMRGPSRNTSGPTQTQRDDYTYAAEAFAVWLPKLRTLVQEDLEALVEKLEKIDAPWTPGRFPKWEIE